MKRPWRIKAPDADNIETYQKAHKSLKSHARYRHMMKVKFSRANLLIPKTKSDLAEYHQKLEKIKRQAVLMAAKEDF